MEQIKPNPEIREIHWPTIVTNDDLKIITEYIQEGFDLPVSVALAIFDENHRLLKRKLGELDNLSASEDQKANLGLLIGHLTGLYASTAVWLLHATEVTISGKPLVTPSNLNDEEEEAVRKFLGKSLEDWEAEEMAHDANWYVTQLTLSELLKRIGPITFINHCAELFKKRMGNNEKAQEAVEQGRKRFHQLYQAAQEEGSS